MGYSLLAIVMGVFFLLVAAFGAYQAVLARRREEAGEPPREGIGGIVGVWVGPVRYTSGTIVALTVVCAVTAVFLLGLGLAWAADEADRREEERCNQITNEPPPECEEDSLGPLRP